jgi:hypothetical protein
VTLYEYLTALPLDPANPLSPRLAVYPYPPKQPPAAPWAEVSEGQGFAQMPLYLNKDLMGRLVTVWLYQPPSATPSVPPDATLLTGLWNRLSDAVHFVNADHSGNRFVALHRVVEMAPYANRDRGLEGFVRFRLMYYRP